MPLVSNTGTLTVTSSQPTWLASRPNLFQWYSVAGVTIASTGSGQGICAYSGATIDRTTSTLYLNGGGHTDYGGNEVLRLNLLNNTLAWSVARASGGGSGRPVSRHTCWDIVFSHTRNKMMLMGAKSLYPDPNADNIVHAFNPATGDWDSAASIFYTNLPAGLNTNVSTGVVEDGAGNIWIANDNFKVSKFLANGTWQNLADEPTTASYTYGGAYDPLNNRVVMFRGSTSAWWNAATNARTGFSIALPKDASPLWCDDLGDFLYLRWDTGVVSRINNDTYAASTLALAGSAPVPSNDGYGWIQGRFFYCPVLKIVGYVRDASTDFHFFRTG
jgi:hypothetical protein